MLSKEALTFNDYEHLLNELSDALTDPDYEVAVSVLIGSWDTQFSFYDLGDCYDDFGIHVSSWSLETDLEWINKALALLEDRPVSLLIVDTQSKTFSEDGITAETSEVRPSEIIGKVEDFLTKYSL